MKLHLSRSSNSESSDDDDDSLTEILNVAMDQDRATTVGQAASAFALQVISEAEQKMRVLLPTPHVHVNVDGASARVIPLYEENMHGLQLIDVALWGAFAELGHRRLLFLRLQQELLSHFPSGERLYIVRVSDPLLSLRETMESLYGWRLTDDEGDSANAPRHRFWTWHHPVHALFHVRGIPVSHTLSAVEKLLVGHGSEDQVSYAPVGSLHVHVRMDAFIRPPVQQAQQFWWDDDTVPATPLHIRNPATFDTFFARIVAHCRALGNMELERGYDLLVVSIDHLTWEGGADPRHVRILFSFLVALAQIFVRPLFVHKDVIDTLMDASDGDPFALVEAPRPQLEPVADEDYMVWVPQRRTDEVVDDSQPLIVEVSDDDEEEPSRKRARLTYAATCAQCKRKGARYLAPLRPMCSRQCVRDFYLIR
jgi:hypothetical protein